MKNKTVNRKELTQYIADLLQIARYHDYCPNGLQVEGREAINLLVTGVTASVALLEQAIDLRADAVLVHHGYFWRNEDPRVIGQKKQRLELLLKNNVSLLAYHLPLDSHETLGNNAQLAKILGLLPERRFAENDLGWLGSLSSDIKLSTLADFALHIESKLGRTPLLIGDPCQSVGQIAWCTGAAQSLFNEAIDAGAKVFLSGEISESTVHLARESEVAYLACGHHATERYGVQALGQHLAQQFGIEHQFIDVDNPV